MKRSHLAGLMAVAFLALAAVIFSARALEDDPPVVAPGTPFEGALIPPGVAAPDFALSDQDGSPISMADFRGRPVIVTFLYTDCDETCPPQVQQIKLALDRLGEDVPALAIAVDPPGDTPAAARRFLSEQRMTGRMSFVLGSREQLEPLWAGYSIRPQEAAEEHQARIVLVDGRGVQRVGFPGSQVTPERLAADLRRLGAG